MRGQTAKRARKAKTLDTRVTKLEQKKIEGPKRDRKERFRFPEPPHSGRTVLKAEGLAKSYGGPPVFTDVTFSIGRGERLLILGLNGAGKTTLLRILTDQTDADEGIFTYGHGVEPGYYAQEHEGINDGETVLDHMKDASSEDDLTLRTLLGMFDLHGDIAFQDAGTLSGGEKTKLALAQLVAGRKNLLLLDEPTNNLDPPSRTAIAEALRGWPGTMIIVSHDPGIARHLAEEFPGNLRQALKDDVNYQRQDGEHGQNAGQGQGADQQDEDERDPRGQPSAPDGEKRAFVDGLRLAVRARIHAGGRLYGPGGKLHLYS